MNEPFAPEGAPPRPVWSQLPRKFLLYNISVVMGFPCVQKVAGTTVASVIFVPLFLFICCHLISLWRFYNRTGWYELKSIEVPQLPCRNHDESQFILYGFNTPPLAAFG